MNGIEWVKTPFNNRYFYQFGKYLFKRIKTGSKTIIQIWEYEELQFHTLNEVEFLYNASAIVSKGKGLD